MREGLSVGTKVVTIMGIHRTGTIIKPFYWRESNDGTYKAPRSDYVPVQWDDGTKGYIWEYHITEVRP